MNVSELESPIRRKEARGMPRPYRTLPLADQRIRFFARFWE